jgi:hypothetical protein
MKMSTLTKNGGAAALLKVAWENQTSQKRRTPMTALHGSARLEVRKLEDFALPGTV